MTMTTMTTMADDAGFQVQQSRSKTNKKRIYISNLSQSDNLKSELTDFIRQQTSLVVNEDDVTIVRQGDDKPLAALVACPDVNKAISILNNIDFQGNKLTVQRERKKRPNNIKKQPLLGGGGWNRPTSSAQQPPKEAPKNTTTSKTRGVTRQETKQNDEKLFDNELELSQHVGSIVADELKAAEQDGDVVNTMIASTAAMTLLSSTEAFGLDQHNTNEMKTDASPEQPSQSALTNKKKGPNDDQPGDFMSQSKKPLSELLADYGEQDLDFQKVVPTETAPPTAETPKTASKKREDYNNRLTLYGKAPIHVEVTSFGYMHGVPSDVRSGGWSHAHPLAPVDCRSDLPQVPHYMARQDGLSPHVKRALLNARDEHDESKRDDRIKTCANQLGQEMFNALHEAISVGGHGHASPLRMTVYVGSETGRHRSVVVCELAATALRKLLRANKDNQITQPVSVGTRHRDIERRQQARDAAVRCRPKQSKQMEFESEW